MQGICDIGNLHAIAAAELPSSCEELPATLQRSGVFAKPPLSKD